MRTGRPDAWGRRHFLDFWPPLRKLRPVPSVFDSLALLHPDGLLGVALGEDGLLRVVYEDALAVRLLQRSSLGPLQPPPFTGAAGLVQAARDALTRRASRQDPVERELSVEASILRVRAVVLPPGLAAEDAGEAGARARAKAYIALFLEDVSLARAFEQELRRSRELMYAVVEATTDAVYVKDPQGHYLFINAAGAHALGQTVSGVVGHTDAQLFPPAEAQVTRAHDLEVLARRETLTYEETGDTAGDGRVWQSTKGVLLHPDGRVRALFGTSRDVTERRRAQALHERLLGIIGHDLRSPLTALSLDLLQLRRQGLDPRTEPVLTRLARTSRRVERLVALLLDYTQLHAGRPLQLNRRTVELRGLLEAALGEAQGGHAPRSVEVRGEPVHAALDRPRMMQVLVQLLDNALRHSLPGSPVDVEVQRVVQREEERVRVRIHNEGETIPLERLQHLFTPQEPRGSAETTVRLSLGLGLFLARATVEAHGGRLEVSSSREEGTRVSVDLPLSPPR